jgi:hypothetical protein
MYLFSDHIGVSCYIGSNSRVINSNGLRLCCNELASHRIPLKGLRKTTTNLSSDIQ